MLIGHYQQLLNAPGSGFPRVIKNVYVSKNKYLNFLRNLHKAEAEIIRASIETMRRGTQKQRRQWFENIKEKTGKIRMAEAEEIYSPQ